MTKNSNFIISTDSCVDLYKSYLEKNGVHSITMKWIVNGTENSKHFNTPAEFDGFYETIKKGALPTTVALNPEELQDHFAKIIQQNPQGDIIHIPLSSGLSVTCDSAGRAADTINKTLNGRKVYVIDSLIATHGMAWLVEHLLALRDAGTGTQDAIKSVQALRDRMHAWIIMNDLFHLKRGGRISGVKATIGTMLNLKPIVIVNAKGKLAIETKVKGVTFAVEYLLKKMQDYGEKTNPNFGKSTIYLARTTDDKAFELLQKAIIKKYPDMKIKEGRIGPVIGTHLGAGSAVLVFEGAKRLEIN